MPANSHWLSALAGDRQGDHYHSKGTALKESAGDEPASTGRECLYQTPVTGRLVSCDICTSSPAHGKDYSKFQVQVALLGGLLSCSSLYKVLTAKAIPKITMLF